MTKEKDTPQDGARKALDKELCPQCGEPLERCDCAKRWENEGGFVPGTRPG